MYEKRIPSRMRREGKPLFTYEFIGYIFPTRSLVHCFQRPCKYVDNNIITARMYQSNVTVLDLPSELLLLILKNLSNIDVLYSSFQVYHHRLTQSLNFVNTTSGDLLPIHNLILDRFCTNTLRKIGFRITSLTFHSKSLEAVLFADDSPHLTELKLCYVNNNTASHYLTGKTIFCYEYRFRSKIRSISILASSSRANSGSHSFVQTSE